MVIINNEWRGNILITKANDFVKTPVETIVKCHTKRNYGQNRIHKISSGW